MHYDWIKINAYLYSSYILGIPLAVCDYKE